jgi:ankyrin repeat protein
LLHKRIPVAELLQQRGVSENLFDAVYCDQLDNAARLLSIDKSLAHATNSSGLSVAEAASAIGRAEILKLLLDKGVRAEFANARNGRTLLHLAAIYNRTNTAELLVRRGAKVEAFDRLGLTPLHVAAAKGATETAVILLKHRANPNRLTASPSPMPASTKRRTVGLDGYSPLHFAAMGSQTNIIQLLLQSGASVNATNSGGRTALDVAGSAESWPPGSVGQFSLMQRLQLVDQFEFGEKSSPAPLIMRTKGAARLLEKNGGKRSSQNNR